MGMNSSIVQERYKHRPSGTEWSLFDYFCIDPEYTDLWTERKYLPSVDLIYFTYKIRHGISHASIVSIP